jgi:hypothetical protein
MNQTIQLGVIRIADYYPIYLFYKTLTKEVAIPLTNIFRVNNVSVSDKLNDCKTIELNLSIRPNVRQQQGISLLRQGIEIGILIRKNWADVFFYSGIVIDTPEQREDASGKPTFSLSMRGRGIVLANAYSPDKTDNMPLLNAASLFVDRVNSVLDQRIIDVRGSEGVRERNKSLETISILDRIGKYEDIEESYYFTENDRFDTEPNLSYVEMNTEIKMFKLLELADKYDDSLASYTINESDCSTVAVKTIEPKITARLYKNAERYVLQVVSNLLGNHGRRDKQENDKERAILLILKSLLQDNTVEIRTTQPFNFKIGEPVYLNLPRLSFQRIGYLVERKVSVTNNSFVQILTFNASLPNLIKQLKTTLKI